MNGCQDFTVYAFAVHLSSEYGIAPIRERGSILNLEDF